MNWYKKAINTQILEWDKIHSNFDYHAKQILDGKKPAGHFDVQFDNSINYMNYPKVFDFIRYIKANRPDLNVYYTYQIQRDGTTMKAYVIGQPQACLSILEGMKKMTYQENKANIDQAHKLFGEGVGYTQEEIDEFLKKDTIETKSTTEPSLVINKI